jgi:3-deoxy-D-manno-octulosonic acid kinase
LNQSSPEHNLQILTYRQGNNYCVFDAEVISDFCSDMLTSEYWLRHKAVTGTAQGRGTTWFVAYHGHEWVLRHYYRGGLIGKLIKDLYLFITMANTRAAREFELLNKLQRLQLPAPRPVAYSVQRRGLFYKADLLSSRIQDAKDLVAILTEHDISHDIWHALGETIKRFHDHGIYHHDLNAHNILLDKQNKIWLIDFDRGEQRKPEKKWQQANMVRLLRSFEKELCKIKGFQWSQENWQALLAGYQSI